MEKNKIEIAAMKTKEHWTNGSGYFISGFDANRDKYANFEALFPELLTVFSETEPVETEEPNQYIFRKKQ